jgi:hypothetical protein
MKNHHHGHIAKANPAPKAKPSHESIAKRAHEIWVSKGHPENSAMATWVEAEAQLIAIQGQDLTSPFTAAAGQ